MLLIFFFLYFRFCLIGHETTQVRTDETVDVSFDGQVRHTITQVTKTTFLEDQEMEVEEELRVEQVVPVNAEGGLASAATWHSGEQDTSQVSVSSLPEDEKSEPTTATVSSTTSTTTGADAIGSAIVVEHSEHSSNIRVTVEQKGTF